MEAPQQYYRSHGPMTAGAAQLSNLPRDVARLREIIQGVLIHVHMAPWLYDVKLSEQRQNDQHLRPIPEVLARIGELSPRPLTAAREPGNRMAAVCRHFSLMLCAILREQGVPARARCGFGAYFNSGRFEDHWVCEYWNAAQARWVLVDAQLDPVQRNALAIDFDPLDVPRDRFIIAGDAWRRCRSGRSDPDLFGLSMVPGLRGLWFIGGNVIRDLASLNRVEMLPWDVWGIMATNDAGWPEDNRKFLDRVAELTLADDGAFAQVRAIYDDERLRVPSVVFNALRNAPEKIGG